jgi:hypothetical protein
MAETCETIFSDHKLKELNLRYFDPTLSAAGGHEDKGLIECLMVKCAKALVYCAGEKESYGKDAEAAMALSLGKPVIFYCDQKKRSGAFNWSMQHSCSAYPPVFEIPMSFEGVGLVVERRDSGLAE